MADGVNLWFWLAFNVLVLGLLALDLLVFHRKPHEVSVREAGLFSAFWIALALAFNAGVFYVLGREAGLEWLTGYLIEKSLSVDNIFVFVLVFAAFAVPAAYQHRVLFWGVLGALVMRLVLILVGAALLERFHWIVYVFGAFLVLTGIRMAREQERHVDVEANVVVRLARRFLPLTDGYRGPAFFVREAGRLIVTPLFVVLLVVEVSDLVFAVDSIPAIFAITTDPFIVYTSNVFAILGLRSLYFLLAGVIERFHLLKLGLAVILVFVGGKMLIVDIYKVPIALSLGFIGLVLAASVVGSLVFPRSTEAHLAHPDEAPTGR